MNGLTRQVCLTLGGSLWAIGGAWGGATEAIAQSAPIESEREIQTMLPEATIATVIVDTAGDWQDFNQFDVLAQPVEGLIQFPHIPTLPDRSLVATLEDWAGEQMALAWLASDQMSDPMSDQTSNPSGDGSYGIAIAPLSTTMPASATNAQRYREAIAENWRSLNAVVETQTDRGVEILVLFAPPLMENPPLIAPEELPINLAPIPTVKQSDAVDRPDPTPVFSDAVNEPNWMSAPELEPEPGSVIEPAIEPAIEPETEPETEPELLAPPPPFPEHRSQYAIAQLDDRLLFATRPEAIMDYLEAIQWGEPEELPVIETIDAIETISTHDANRASDSDLAPAALMLSDVPAFSATLARAPENAAAIVYVDMPRVLQALGQMPGFSIPTPDGTDLLEPAELLGNSDFQISTLDGFLWFEPSGARMQFRAHYADPQPQLAALARTDDETLEHIPAASALTLTTRGFDVIMPDILAAYDAIPTLREPLDQARREIRDAIGFDLEADILPLFDGDASLFLFPTDRGFFSMVAFTPLGMGITIETSDRPKLEAIIARLEDLWNEEARTQASDMKALGLTVTAVEGFEVTSWNATSPLNSSMSILGHTWVSDDTLLIATGADLMAELLPVPYQSLTDSYTYQSAIEPFPQPNISLSHINVGSILSSLSPYLLTSTWGSPNNMFDFSRMLQSVRSVTESTTATENYLQDDIHIQLAPRRSEP